MLKQRIITAVVLLAILLPALFYPSPLPFGCVMLVLIAAATWEWGRLNGYSSRMSLFFGIEMANSGSELIDFFLKRQSQAENASRR